MSHYGHDVLLLGVTGALLLGMVAAGRAIVIFASAIGWL